MYRLKRTYLRQAVRTVTFKHQTNNVPFLNTYSKKLWKFVSVNHVLSSAFRSAQFRALPLCFENKEVARSICDDIKKKLNN